MEIKSVPGAPDISSLSHLSAMTRPCWLGRAARNRHRHAIEQASRRWHGGRRDDSARRRRETLIYPQATGLAQGEPEEEEAEAARVAEAARGAGPEAEAAAAVAARTAKAAVRGASAGAARQRRD